MGGGGSTAINKSSVATSIVSSVITKNLTQHYNAVQQEQQIIVSGNFANVSNIQMGQTLQIDVSASTTDDQISNMQDDITAQLQQAADASSSAVFDALGTGSTSENDVQIQNAVSSLVDNETVTNIINQVNQDQILIVSGNHDIVTYITFDQMSDMIDQGVLQLTQQNDTITKLDNALSQTTTSAETNPISEIIDAIGGAIESGLTGVWMPVIVFIIVVAFIILVSMYFKRGTQSTELSSPYLRPANISTIPPGTTIS